MKKKLEPMGQFFNDRADIYDNAHLGHISDSGGMEGKELVAQYLPEDTRDILDLGCGTGLELPAIFARFPQAKVVGIDLAQDMLALLHERCAGFDVQTLCMSYFDYKFPPEACDAVISVMSLHHFTPAQKLELFTGVRKTLRPGGVFLNCDYFANSPMQERMNFAKLVLKRQKAGETHFDTPLTAGHEMKLLRQAGFAQIDILWQQGTAKLIQAATA